jgi:hypothetical protein
MKTKNPKPDISLANKTGHFNLLTTASKSYRVKVASSKSYLDNPTALHLRAMNMLYEGLKEKGAMMIVPSTAVESMGMGGLLGTDALAQQKLTDKVETAE